MKPSVSLICIVLWIFSSCTSDVPVIEQRTFEAWYAADTLKEIVLTDGRKQAEIHLHDSEDTYYLPYDDFGTFVNDYLLSLDRQYPGREVVVRIR